jgi:hypothetical protein
LQGRGKGFESPQLHQPLAEIKQKLTICLQNFRTAFKSYQWDKTNDYSQSSPVFTKSLFNYFCVDFFRSTLIRALCHFKHCFSRYLLNIIPESENSTHNKHNCENYYRSYDYYSNSLFMLISSYVRNIGAQNTQ